MEDEICEMRVLLESTVAVLKKEKQNNDIKDSEIEDLNERLCRISEEKMRMKNRNNKSIEDLEWGSFTGEGKTYSNLLIKSKRSKRNHFSNFDISLTYDVVYKRCTS